MWKVLLAMRVDDNRLFLGCAATSQDNVFRTNRLPSSVRHMLLP
jgi:hypothetical protein